MKTNSCRECDLNGPETSFEEVNSSINYLASDMNKNYNHVEFPNNLYYKSHFNKVVDRVCSNRHHLVSIVLNDTSRIKKEISLLALQYLCIDDYLPLVENLYLSYSNGKLEKEYFIYSMHSYLSDELVKNYDNEGLRSFIDTLIKDSTFSDEERLFFIHMKSGKLWEGIKNSPPS